MPFKSHIFVFSHAKDNMGCAIISLFSHAKENMGCAILGGIWAMTLFFSLSLLPFAYISAAIYLKIDLNSLIKIEKDLLGCFSRVDTLDPEQAFVVFLQFIEGLIIIIFFLGTYLALKLKWGCSLYCVYFTERVFQMQWCLKNINFKDKKLTSPFILEQPALQMEWKVSKRLNFLEASVFTWMLYRKVFFLFLFLVDNFHRFPFSLNQSECPLI